MEKNAKKKDPLISMNEIKQANKMEKTHHSPNKKASEIPDCGKLVYISEIIIKEKCKNSDRVHS